MRQRTGPSFIVDARGEPMERTGAPPASAACWRRGKRPRMGLRGALAFDHVAPNPASREGRQPKAKRDAC